MKLAFLHARIYTPVEEVEDGYLIVEDGLILDVGACRVLRAESLREAEVVELRGDLLVPGFIDLQVNGGSGRDFLEGTEEAVVEAASFHLQHGTTSLLPTLITAPHAELLNAVEAIRRFRFGHGFEKERLPEIIGIHLEGPYISQERKGVHPREWIRSPSLAELRQYQKASGGLLKLMTLAPEVPGSRELIRELKATGIIPSMGHTNATYDEAMAGILAGISFATHVFNAMRGFHHREPGAVGAVLDSSVAAGFVADGFHLHEAALRLLYRVKGVEDLILVTDAVSLAGVEAEKAREREYRLGSRRIILRDGKAVALDGTLAGPTLTMEVALQNLVRFLRCPFKEAVQMATLNPARLLGIEARKGRLAPGCDADLVVLDERLEVKDVWVRGKRVKRCSTS